MMTYKGVNIFSNDNLSRDRFYKVNEGFIMHPYNIGMLILRDLKEGYLNVFKCIGINQNSIDVCADFAKRKVRDYINNVKT